jgi:hypothetical protein
VARGARVCVWLPRRTQVAYPIHHTIGHQEHTLVDFGWHRTTTQCEQPHRAVAAPPCHAGLTVAAQIKRRNPVLNAVVTLDAEQVRERALARGEG